jgi:hypothetical protein
MNPGRIPEGILFGFFIIFLLKKRGWWIKRIQECHTNEAHGAVECGGR